MLLLIDNYDSFTYNLYQALAAQTDVMVVRNDAMSIAAMLDLQPNGIILSPGPGLPEHAGVCIALIQALIQLERCPPVLGVCLGHQAIVVALGGRVVQADAIVHGKQDEVYHQQTHLYQALTTPFKVGRYHSLIAERSSLPASLIIEAENHAGLVMGVRHATLPIYGVQFHPESILTPAGDTLLTAFVARCQAKEQAA